MESHTFEDYEITKIESGFENKVILVREDAYHGLKCKRVDESEYERVTEVADNSARALSTRFFDNS